MLKIFLTVVLPLALPLLVYIGYVSFLRRRAQLTGQQVMPRWQEGPWPWMILAGAVLVVAALITYRVTTGVSPGTQLEPPRLIDGEVVPSRVRE